MSTLQRWLRFNLVGVLGAAVQLGVLGALARRTGSHYLLATALALEVTLLHNFAWHWLWTWRDERAGLAPWTALLRFHVTNGLMSLAGNLLLVRLLVRGLHVRLGVADAAAIAVCSLLNFLAARAWAFSQGGRKGAGTKVYPVRRECYR